MFFQYARKAERDAKLVAANANISNTLVTPISGQHTTRFTLNHSATPSSEDSRHSAFS